jgi:hypothetical protein
MVSLGSLLVDRFGSSDIEQLIHALITRDSTRLKRHYDLLHQWAKFLVRNGLIPEHQLSTDDFAGKNDLLLGHLIII